MPGPTEYTGTERRSQPRRSRLAVFLRDNWYRDLWLLIITVVLAVALLAFENEGQKRQNQTCTLFERNHFDAVAQLKATYDYVQNLKLSDMKGPNSGLNRAVVLQLPDTERKAKSTVPPKYCWPQSVGDERPLPVIPARPPGLLPLH